MTRAMSTLPASLLTAYYMNSNSMNPFQAYLMTFSRSTESHEMVSNVSLGVKR